MNIQFLKFIQWCNAQEMQFAYLWSETHPVTYQITQDVPTEMSKYISRVYVDTQLNYNFWKFKIWTFSK